MFEYDVKRGDAWDRNAVDAPDVPDNPDHPLDSDENVMLHGRLLSYYQQELDRQYDNRIQQAIDEDFYDHIQWTDEDAAELRNRGQSPMVYNVLAQTINWIIGSEKRGRTDFKVLPRRKDDGESASRKTQLLKYLSDVNQTVFHRSRAFEDAAKVGIGWLEDGVTEADDGEPIYSRYESWRNILWDSACTEMNLSDCRYVTRTKWVDVDVAKALFPDRDDLIELSKEEGVRYGYDGTYADEVMDQHEMQRENNSGYRATDFTYRDRVRLIEIWFRKPERVKRVIEGDWRGEIYDDKVANPGVDEFVAQAEAEGRQVIAERLMMRMHCAVMTTKGLLYMGPSPYRHNRFPFTPIWGYRRGRDGLPYGVIRGLRDIQEDINKRASKALYILSTNKVIMDEGAVEDLEEFRREVSRPDAIIEKKTGKSIDINVDRELSQWQLELMSRNINMIQQVGGVTDEMLGRTTNAVSGSAITARQEQGALSTSKLFDNLRFAFQDQGVKQLSLIEQFMTEEKQFRITNERGTPEFVTVNDGLPENDIVRQKADFIVSEGEWRASLRQAQAEQLMEMLTRMPAEVALIMLDLVVETMDLPNRDELVQRIRQINGQSDPDADPDSPEEQAKAQAQAAQQQMQQALMEAQLRKAMAEAGKTEAEIAKMQSEITKTAAEIAGKNMDTQEKAINAAVQAVLNQPAIPVADTMLAEAGFVSATDQAMQQQAMAEQQAMAQQPAPDNTMQSQMTPGEV